MYLSEVWKSLPLWLSKHDSIMRCLLQTDIISAESYLSYVCWITVTDFYLWSDVRYKLTSNTVFSNIRSWCSVITVEKYTELHCNIASYSQQCNVSFLPGLPGKYDRNSNNCYNKENVVCLFVKTLTCQSLLFRVICPVNIYNVLQYGLLIACCQKFSYLESALLHILKAM